MNENSSVELAGAKSCPDHVLLDKARMLVNVSERLGLPLGGDGAPELQAAIALVRAERGASA